MTSGKKRGFRGPTTDQKQTLRISPKSAEGLSSFRKEAIERDIENGAVQEGRNYNASNLNKAGAGPQTRTTDMNSLQRGAWLPGRSEERKVSSGTSTAVGAIAHSESFVKQAAGAAFSSSSSGAGTTAGSSVERLAPEVYSPLFTMANLNLPRDRITVNAWIRNFFQLHPIVRNAITLHATYPISKINFKCHNKKVLQFFEDMAEEMGLMQSLGDLSLEYWKMGESFPYAELNEETGKWSKIVIQNPDYIHVKKTVLSGEPIISLKPDAVLQRLVMSNNPADVQLRKQIPEKIIYHVRKGEDIPLDNFNVSHLKMLSSPYDVRGTSVIVSVFKDLMLYDKLREAKFAQADGLVNPITIVKVGGNTDGEYRATQEDLEFFRQMFEEAQYDKDFKLITHAGVAVERVGASGQVLDIGPDMELIIKNIYTGLMVPPAVVDTESAVYASASIGLEVLRQRYFNFRHMMAQWLQSKIFAPISEINDFYDYEGGSKRLIVPEVEWNQMNLYDLQDYIANISGLVANKQVSLQTLYKSLGLSYEDERVKIREEMINDEIRNRENESLRKMTIAELRTLDPEKEVMEPIDDKERAAAPGGMPPEAAGMPGGMPGEMALPGGLGELAPPPGGGGGPPGGGAPEIPGGLPPLGPGTPGGPGGGGPGGGPGV
jgi:hypothetical protein